MANTTRTPTPDNIAELLALYAEGHSASSLAQRAGVGRIVFERWLREAGVPTRGHSRQGRHRHTSRNGGKSPTYQSWQKMKDRCENPKHPSFSDYGGRGIAACDRWQRFDAFLADMGERPDGCSLDRIDVNGNYEPGNCRWATAAEQRRNMRRNVWLSFNGRTLCAKDWSTATGLSKSAILYRFVDLGWDAEKTLTTPAGATHERRITHNGETLCIAEWARRLGVSYPMLAHRHRRGWPDHEVLFGRATR